MKKPLSIKIQGDLEDVREFLKKLEKEFSVVSASQFVKNDTPGGVHVFVVITAAKAV